MSEEQRWLSVKELADMGGVSRQTLIYYDSIDLLKPDFVDENGYRKYSVNQIMELRKILFLKNNHIPLEEIRENMKKGNLDSVKDGMKHSREKLLEKIEELHGRVKQLNNQIRHLERASVELYTVSIPMIKYFPERLLVWKPWKNTDNMSRQELYRTFMELRKMLEAEKLSDDLGWGSIIQEENLLNKNWLFRGGGYIYLSSDTSLDLEKYKDYILRLPAGEYLCMNKFGMPHDRKPVDELLHWIETHNFKYSGILIDECLLDTTYQRIDNTKRLDFSQLQILAQR